LDEGRAARRKRKALRLLAAATRADALTVMKTAAAAMVRAGYSLFMDGQECGVFIDGERVLAPIYESARKDGSTPKTTEAAQ
jgi:hypothetical protein